MRTAAPPLRRTAVALAVLLAVGAARGQPAPPPVLAWDPEPPVRSPAAPVRPPVPAPCAVGPADLIPSVLPVGYDPGPLPAPALPISAVPAAVDLPPATPAQPPGLLTTPPPEMQLPAAPAQPSNLGAAVNPLPISGGQTPSPGGNSPSVPPKAVEVGNSPGLTTLWDNELIFQSPNKDWRFHFGGRFQGEGTWWAEPERLQGPAPGNGGIPVSGRGAGVGSLDDGIFFRRVRLRADGVAYENLEFILEVDFEQLNYVTYDHLWFGYKDVPYLGTVRVGQHKVPQGMDNLGSDYHLTFLERAVLSEGIWASLFAPGVLVANTFLDDNVTFQTMFHRVQPVVQFFTGDFGDGNYADTTRLTWTPLYENEGAHLVHVGGSYQWRTGDLGRTIQPGGTGNAFADTQDVVRFRARPELRNAVGVGTVGNGLLGGNPARFVDTGFLLAKSVSTFSPEFLTILGPFSVQAEAAWAVVQGARTVYPTTAAGAPNLAPRGSPTFWGGYVEASYFLTGEHRGYDRRFGTFDRPRVRENFFLVRGEGGRINRGLGAWQVGYRYSFLDLNSNGISGGQLGQHTAVVNWYLNDNAKLQFQYSNVQRNVIAPAVSGTVHGFGILGQWYF